MGAISAALATMGGCTAVRCIMDCPGRREAEYCHGRVRLRLFWNEGAAFSLPLPPKLLPAASGAMLGALWHQRKRAPIGVGLLLGGGLSNLYERVWRGRVRDGSGIIYSIWRILPSWLAACACWRGGRSRIVKTLENR